jgi:hypothetical protein
MYVVFASAQSVGGKIGIFLTRYGCAGVPPFFTLNDWMRKMKKMFTLLAIPLAQAAMVSAFAQAPAATSTDPSASQSRAEVKSGASAANADRVNQFNDRPGAAVKGSGTSRAEVKSGASAAEIDKVNQFQDKPTAGMPSGNKSRAEVKAERNAGAGQLRANTEVPTPGTSSQQNLKNPKALTPEERAARREARKQRAAERRAKRAESRTAASGKAAGTEGTRIMPADGGAGAGNPAPGK